MPSKQSLNFTALYALLIGIIIASLTTTAISDPEYPSLYLPNSKKSSSVKLFGVLPSLVLNISPLA